MYDYPEGEPHPGCPLRKITQRAAVWLSLYNHYEAGHLWCAGGIRDQPARYLAAMNVAGAEFGDLNEKIREEDREAAERARGQA